MFNTLLTSSIFEGGITGDTINLIFLGVGLLFVALAMFWGMVRGLKRTTFRAVWLIVTAAILFFITPLITGMLLNVNLSFLNVDIDGVQLTTLKELGTTMLINQGLGDLAQNAVVWELVQKLPGLVLNAFLFVVLFWVFKTLLWPVWAIIASSTIKKKDKKGNKVKKYRFAGMLVGGVLGLFIGATTLMPIVNVAKLAAKIETETVDFTEGDGGLLTELAGDDAVSMLNSFNDSQMNMVYKYSAMDALSSAMFKGLTTTNIAGHSINLENDVLNAIVTYKLVTDLQDIDFENLTQEQITVILNKVDAIIDAVFNIGLINGIGDELLPYMVDGLTSGDEFFVTLPETGDQTLDQVIIDSIATFEDFKFSDLKTDLKAMVATVRTVNDAGLITTIMDQMDTEQEMDIATIQSLLANVDDELIDDIFDSLFTMKSISNLSPIALNAGIGYAAQALELADFDPQEVDATASDLKTTFSGLFKISLAILNDLDETSEFYITSLSVSKAGELLDLLKNHLGTNYTALMGAGVDYLNEMLDSSDISLTVPGAIMHNLRDVLDNLTTISNFATEFTIYSNMFDDAITVYTAITNEEEINFQTVGNILDQLKNTYLIGTELTSILVNAIDYAQTMLPEDMPDLTEVFTGIKANVSNNIVWSTELPLFGDIYTYFTNNEVDFENLLSNQTALEEIGGLLDGLQTSQLIGNQLNNLVSAFIGMATDNMPVDELEMFQPIIDAIQDNIDDATTISWADEMGYFVNLMSIMDNMGESYDLVALGEALDSLDGSQLITHDTINSIITTLIDDLLAEDPNIPSDVTDSLTENISNIVSYEAEFTYLNDFLNTFTSLDFDNVEGFSFTTLGQEFDTYDGSVLVAPLREILVVTLFENLVPEDPLDDTYDMLNSLYTDVETNVGNITSYETEFGYIEDLIDLMTDLDTLTTTEIGVTLDNLSGSAILFNVGTYVTNNLFEMLVPTDPMDENYSMLNSIYTDVINNSSSITSYQTEFAYIQGFTDMFDNLDTLTAADIGTELDDLTNSAILFNVGLYVTTDIFDTAIDEAPTTPIDIQATLTGVKTNTLQQIGNHTLTYTQALTQFEALGDSIQDAQDYSDITTNFDGATLATTFIDLRNNTIFGATNTADLATDVIEDIVSDLQVEMAGYNSGDPEYIALDAAITELNGYVTDIDANPATVDYTTLFDNMDDALSTVGH